MTMVVSSSNATVVDTQSPPAPAIQTPSIFSPDVPAGPPPSRSYSVTAPTDLQRSVQRQQEQPQPPPSDNMPWWQYYYQMYHYHPPAGRKPTVFGPYLLLHTLGEGEFGKVKLGIHIESSQEVAIKLIKKDHIDSSSRMTKVEREISVLRTVCHPYIVKLYDVIETEKYIGIILQCASGGELFEYILAHRYLKERDACRLFAQLISGVHYMHQKHIVHRDLKLENLLLDRDRNIIITDFGFANQFSSAKNDLMATSCGSPCYAAPELVVSEGMYVGSAVDIWSCGVILYAMLCGYLPFDDDPANPEGDNINLLYKYILNTQLAFPDYVSDDARDLLQKMLVPDPAKRCTMQIIMEHNWLRPHRDLFEKTVDDLEVQAMETSDLPVRQQLMQQQEQQKEISDTPVQPTGPSLDDDHEQAAISAKSSDDAMVPTAQSMEVDSDDARVPKENRQSDSSIMIHSEKPDECSVKGTMTATDLESAPDMSTLELPASMHTESSESTAEKVSDIPDAAPVEEEKPSTNDSMECTPSPAPNGSILQAKFLSSIQRQQQQQQQQQQSTQEEQEQQPNLMSISTPQPTVPIPSSPPARRQRSPSSALPPQQPTKHHNKDGARGTRRKALSLLVNSMTDHLHDNTRQHLHGNPKKTAMTFTRKHGTRERAQSVLTSNNQRYSGLKRVVGKDRTTSENNDALPRSSMHVMPSVSEQTVIHDKDKHKSAGKKLMEWFKKKPLSTRHGYGDMLTPDRPLSSLQRAMPLGKSYAVDFNDNKLRTHHGAVDQEALTSGSPVDVLVEVKQALLSMGIDVKKDGEYKLKCVRQRRKRPSSQDSTTSSSSNSRTDKKRRMSTSAPFRKLLRRSAHQTADITGGDIAVFQTGETVYGDPVVDPGEEVRFSVELCKIKNLPGLYIVDIRRMRGNVWAYKFLYHTLLDTLNLSGKGGYIKSPHSQQRQQQNGVTTTASSSSSSRKNANRNSCSSSGGSSSMLEDVKEEE